MYPSLKSSSSSSTAASSSCMQDMNLYEMDVEDFSSDVPTDQLPSVEEVRTQAQMMMKRSSGDNDHGSSRFLKKIWVMAACLVFVVVVIVAVVVPLAERPLNGSDPISENVEAAILRVSLNGKADFEDETSYNSIAMRWLKEDQLVLQQDYSYDQLRQRYGMYCLYHATGALAWTNTTGWKRKGVPECRWFGVTCDSNGFVDRLNLRGNGLMGQIPPEVSLIPKLTVLNVNANPALKGSIPDHVCHLARTERALDVKVDCLAVECSCCSTCQIAD